MGTLCLAAWLKKKKAAAHTHTHISCVHIYIAIKWLYKAQGHQGSGANFLPFRVPEDSTDPQTSLRFGAHYSPLRSPDKGEGQIHKTNKGPSKCVTSGIVSHVKETLESWVSWELSTLPDFPSPAQETRRPECCIFKYFWRSPLATYVSNIPSWLPHVQALASSLYWRVLCCFKAMVGPRSSHFSFIFSWSYILETATFFKKISSKKCSYLKYLFPLRLFFNST